jgi:hypothetical protein
MYRDPGVLAGGGGYVHMDPPEPAPPHGDGSYHLHGKAPDYHSRNPFDEHHPGFRLPNEHANPFPDSAYHMNDEVARYRTPHLEK